MRLSCEIASPRVTNIFINKTFWGIAVLSGPFAYEIHKFDGDRRGMSLIGVFKAEKTGNADVVVPDIVSRIRRGVYGR